MSMLQARHSINASRDPSMFFLCDCYLGSRLLFMPSIQLTTLQFIYMDLAIQKKTERSPVPKSLLAAPSHWATERLRSMRSTPRQCSDRNGFVSEQGLCASPQSDLVAPGHHLILPGFIFLSLKCTVIYINEPQELLGSMRILIKRTFSFLPLRSPSTNPLLFSAFVIISASH